MPTLIDDQYPSRRSRVSRAQVALIGRLIGDLDKALLRHFTVRLPKLFPLDRFNEIWQLTEYQLFCDGCYASGFVCRDYEGFFDLNAANEDPVGVLGECNFEQLRFYLHTLQRGERWADGYSSPVLEAVASGALSIVGERLAKDQALDAHEADDYERKAGSDGLLMQGHKAFFDVLQHGTILIDANNLELAAINGHGFDVIERWRKESADGIYDGKEVAVLMRAIVGRMLPATLIPTPGRRDGVRQVSLEPSPEPHLRRAVRLLSAVHELHKAGYQRLRISAGMAPSGMYWRCFLTSADNIREDGWSLLDDDVTMRYTTGDESCYFGWDDAVGIDARKLARMFVERCPSIAERATGHDWAYAGWFTAMLGAAENGRLPVFFADYPPELVPGQMPPPPPRHD
jgi:hypothetical protein